MNDIPELQPVPNAGRTQPKYPARRLVSQKRRRLGRSLWPAAVIGGGAAACLVLAGAGALATWLLLSAPVVPPQSEAPPPQTAPPVIVVLVDPPAGTAPKAMVDAPAVIVPKEEVQQHWIRRPGRRASPCFRVPVIE